MKNRFKNLRGWRTGCPTGSAETGQKGLFGVAEEATAAIGCPIDIEQTAEYR